MSKVINRTDRTRQARLRCAAAGQAPFKTASPKARRRPPRGDLSRTGQALRPRSGQALLLVVVMIGGVLFLVTAVAGLLMYYQVQQSNDIANSTVAIFAADAGIERALYYYFYEYDPGTCQFSARETPPCPVNVGTLTLGNGAAAEDIQIVIPNPADPIATAVISANGKDAGRRTIRALETRFLLNP